MVLVTDKQYYMDENLRDNLDFCIERQKKNFDHLLIIDGKEGYGKSTFGASAGYYLAWKTGKSFDINNIFFDMEEMFKFASSTEEQVILWDEAALGGLASEWQNKFQKKLIKLLMVARKKRHFWVFIVPHFLRLNEYLAVDRSIALIHIYSHDNITRGRFVFFSTSKKDGMYSYFRTTHKKDYSRYDFHGRFTDTSFLINQEEYDKKKDAAIASLVNDDEQGKHNIKILSQQYLITKLDRYSKTEIAELLHIDRKTLYLWSLIPEKYPKVADFLQNWGIGHDECVESNVTADEILEEKSNGKETIE